MSVRIMTAVWSVTLPDSEKIVLLALADCANDEGLCWPSMATLAAKCSKSERDRQAGEDEARRVVERVRKTALGAESAAREHRQKRSYMSDNRSDPPAHR